jgi:hypothetical protein
LFEMYGRQQLIRRSLAEKAAEIGDLYEGALRALSDEANPGRFFLAGHSVREMMDALPRLLNLPMLAEQGRLGDQVSAAEGKWVRAQKSPCYGDGKWEGTIDDILRRGLQAIDELFEWRKQNRPKRRDVASGIFRLTDPSGLALPEPLDRKRADRWLVLHSFFVGVAHRSPTTCDEFSKYLDELEQILLDALYRQPSEDLSRIDAILAEEQPDA